MRQRLQLNFAITHFVERKQPKLHHDPNKLILQQVKEDETELAQFYIDLKRFPLKRSDLDKAFDDVRRLITKELTLKGYIR